MKKISSGKKATKLLSYWHEKKFRKFFLEEKIKLPSYQATEQKISDSIHITCHIYHTPASWSEIGTFSVKVEIVWLAVGNMILVGLVFQQQERLKI